MQKTILHTTLAMFILTATAWFPAMAAEEEMCVPMGDIALESIASEAQRSAVTFPHALHFDYSCRKCHHTWDNTSPIVGCTTSGCHDLAELPKADATRTSHNAQTYLKYYKNAYHDMCIGCHKSIKAKNKAIEASKLAMGEKLPPTGPTGCIECHPNE